MIQKVAVGLLLVALFIGGNISYAHAQGLTVSQLIDLLISAGVISSDKAAAAKAAAGSAALGTPGKSQAAPPACGLSRDLVVGTRGDDVAMLQEKLGIASPTGYFGEQTRNSVKSWQKDYGIPATGNVGPLTRAKWAERYPCDEKSQPQATSSESSASPNLKPMISNVRFYQGNAVISAPITLGTTYRVEWDEKDVTGAVDIYLVEQQGPTWSNAIKLGTVAAHTEAFIFDMPTTFQKQNTHYRISVEGDGVSAHTGVYFDPAYHN